MPTITTEINNGLTQLAGHLTANRPGPAQATLEGLDQLIAAPAQKLSHGFRDSFDDLYRCLGECFAAQAKIVLYEKAYPGKFKGLRQVGNLQTRYDHLKKDSLEIIQKLTVSNTKKSPGARQSTNRQL